MKKALFYFFCLFCLTVLAIRLSPQTSALFINNQAKSGVKISSLPDKARVFIDGVEVGQTPFQNDGLKVGDHEVKLVSGSSQWQGIIRLTPYTRSIINRELAPSVASSSGESLVLSTGRGVTITSSPSGADVEVDGIYQGKTPLSLPALAPGEHNFLIGKDYYLKRNIQASLPDKMLLHIDVTLAMTEIDLASLTNPELKPTSAAIVKETSTGFLRVRSKPSTSEGQEIARVVTGEVLAVIDEVPGWAKIRLKDGSEGYVSAAHISKN